MLWKFSNLTESTANFESTVKTWNKEVFDNIFIEKRTIRVRLEGIQQSLDYLSSSFLHSLRSPSQKDSARSLGMNMNVEITIQN